MHTDELRAELADLANEIETFHGDPAGVRRRVARRRILTGSIAAAVAVALAVTLVSVSRPGSEKVNIAASAKTVSPARLPHLDTVVVLPTNATSDDVNRVRAVLENSNAVEQYAPLPPGMLAFALTNPEPDIRRLRAQVCAAPSTRSFAVELERTVPDAEIQLVRAVGASATVQSLETFGIDVEIFMQVKANPAQVSAVHAWLSRDADVAKDTFVDHRAAYREFAELFADQPVLIENETPQALPESFQLELVDGASAAQFANQFPRLPGVDSVITGSDPWASIRSRNLPLAQACARKP